MQCNLTSGRIYKGSNAQVDVTLYPACKGYDSTAVTDVVLNFYTTEESTSIEFSGDSITISGNVGTVVFQPVQLEALNDGQLKYNVAFNYEGSAYTYDMETRWYLATPNDYTPIDYISSENVEEVVEEIMGDDYVTVTALTETLEDYATDDDLSAALANYATKSDVNTGLARKQDTLVSGTNIKTVNAQSLLGSGNITITPYTGITSNDVTNALGYIPIAPSGATITGIWLGTLAQYDALPSHSSTIIYVIKQ